jgi:serine protease Do
MKSTEKEVSNMTKSKLHIMGLILIGIVAGALIFSHVSPFSRSLIYAYPEQQSQIAKTDEQVLESLRSINQAFFGIAMKVNPTVVTVFTEKIFKVSSNNGNPFFFNSPFEDFFQDFFGRRYQRPEQPKEREYHQRGLGSGVIVSADGYILTNNHVIEEADTIQVRLLNKKTLPVKVIGTDPKTDIAVLKVDAKGLPKIDFGDSDRIRVGEIVLAVGSPMSPNLAHTITQGIVSAKGRSNVGLAEYEDFIQTDAAINPGNSGGALVDIEGKLVGINTAIATQSGGFQGIGFAVPVNMARRIMESLLEYGTVIRGWLGIYIQDIDETMAKAMDLPVTEGTLVSDVSEDSPAQKAGIKQGDVIIEFDGKKVINTTQFRNNIAATAPGTDVTLKVIRDGAEKMISVTLGKLKADEIAPETEEQLEKLFGFNVAPFDQELASKYQINKSLTGVVIVSIDVNSPAHRAGLQEGDLLVAVNRKKIENMEDFNNLVQDLKKGDTIFFQVVRKNRSFYAAFTL